MVSPMPGTRRERMLRYGVIGCGRVFGRYHLPSVRERPAFALAAVCDSDLDSARSILGHDAGGTLLTTDLDEFFTRGRPDVVAVCTPNDQHAEPMLAALSAGIAVLCEKPLAASLQDARAIAAAAAGARLAGVNLPYRFHDLLPAFADAASGMDGEITLTFRTAGQRLWRPVGTWYSDAARAGGGALLDLGVHALDLLTAMFGWPEVRACWVDKPEVEERVAAQLMFGRQAVRIQIDRASRALAFTVEAGQDGRTVALDLRRGELRGPSGVVRSADPRPELLAITQFLAAAQFPAAPQGDQGAVVSVADGLRLQELVATMYQAAAVDPGLAAGR
jgi:predicted dehydrogenase